MTEEGENKGKKNIKESQFIFFNNYLSFNFYQNTVILLQNIKKDYLTIN